MSFNNGGVFHFLNRVKLQRDGVSFTAKNLEGGTAAALCLIFGRKLDVSRSLDGKTLTFVDPGLDNPKGRNRTFAQTNPYFFQMRHKAHGHRRMAVMHLRSQLDVADFYARFADSILYYTNRSPYSIRHPRGKARYSIHRDPMFFENVDNAPETVEQSDHDYEYVRSYFSYSRYSHVYKFYDSAEFRACERKYGLLARVDISKCFDSIYTHSISWATHGRSSVKANISASNGTFGGEFDRLMQALNYDETNGIIIGPEVSRIFAEVILQEVDTRIFSRISKANLVHREDYDILRFVDDYFVFVRFEESRQLILDVIAEELSSFRLHLNESKESVEATPLVSALSIAKVKLDKLLQSEITRQDNEVEPGMPAQAPNIYLPAQALVLGYKSILMDTKLTHAELANYALVRLERVIETSLETYKQVLLSDSFQQNPPRTISEAMGRTVGFLSAALDVSLFIYAGAVSVSHAVKLARITMTAIKFLELIDAPAVYWENFLSKVSKELRAQLEPSARDRAVPMHTLILLDCLTAMGAKHGLSERELDRLLDIDDERKLPDNISHLDAAGALTILSHLGDRAETALCRQWIEDWVLSRVSGAKTVLDGEVGILELNVVSCPYVSEATKLKILAPYDLFGRDLRMLNSLNSRWTYEWAGVDYYERLQRKRANEVY